MNRIDRLTAILTQLQGKKRVPLDELTERFEVSERTIFRDIKALIESGVPIGGDAGEGYFIVEGYHLPPVVFSNQEAAALLLGSKLLPHNADASATKDMESAMHKVRAVLKYADREFLETLDERIAVIAPPITRQQGFPDSHLSEIQTALATRRVVEINYFSNYKNETSKRQVEPMGMVYYSSRWHLIGFCRLRHDLRDFRTDRIEKLTILRDSFDPEDHPDFKAFLHGMTGGTDAKRAVLLFTERMARFLGEQKYYFGFVEERKTDDGVEMTFITPRYEFIASWMLQFVDQVRAVSPPELQGLVATYSKQLLDHHKKAFE